MINDARDNQWIGKDTFHGGLRPEDVPKVPTANRNIISEFPGHRILGEKIVNAYRLVEEHGEQFYEMDVCSLESSRSESLEVRTW